MLHAQWFIKFEFAARCSAQISNTECHSVVKYVGNWTFMKKLMNLTLVYKTDDGLTARQPISFSFLLHMFREVSYNRTNSSVTVNNVLNNIFTCQDTI